MVGFPLVEGLYKPVILADYGSGEFDYDVFWERLVLCEVPWWALYYKFVFGYKNKFVNVGVHVDQEGSKRLALTHGDSLLFSFHKTDESVISMVVWLWTLIFFQYNIFNFSEFDYKYVIPRSDLWMSLWMHELVFPHILLPLSHLSSKYLKLNFLRFGMRARKFSQFFFKPRENYIRSCENPSSKKSNCCLTHGTSGL